jgi:hypothetical protein
MGFVYRLGCPACQYQSESISHGLSPMGETIALIQNQVTGQFRQIAVGRSELLQRSGQVRFASEEEWLSALESYITEQLGPDDVSISPGQLICPVCLGKLDVKENGFM